MIRIEQFLFEYNVERTQAESLISRFPNLSFTTQQEFIDYFASQNITLTLETKVGQGKPVFQEKDELLQKFKDFKSSTDYDYVKKYISEQRRIQDAINSGNVEASSNLLDGITSTPIDPFFNFIVRKMLTGSENGVLPSEKLRSLLDEITKKTKREIDITVSVTRDELGRVVSFDNYLRNKGSLKVDLLDERFTVDSFNYVVNKEFDQIEDAVNAEKNVLRRAAEFDTLFPVDATGDGVIDNRDIIENLKKLIVQDSNSVPALQSRLESLQQQLSDINELIDIREEDIESLNRVIDELAEQRNLINDENEVKDQTIISLNEVIDATLAELEDRVSQQLTNTTDAFDALATQIETQAKKSEEAAAKQLAAFEKAVGGLAEALKPAEPEPDPGNPAADVINNVLKEFDKIYVITNTTVSAFERILTLIGIQNRPKRTDYVVHQPVANDAFGPGQEIDQILNWNRRIKNEIKNVISAISDVDDANKILLETKTFVVSPINVGTPPIVGVITNALNQWAVETSTRRARGVGAPTIKRFVQEINPNYVWSVPLDGTLTETQARSVINNGIGRRVTEITDVNRLLALLDILAEIKNKVAESDTWRV